MALSAVISPRSGEQPNFAAFYKGPRLPGRGVFAQRSMFARAVGSCLRVRAFPAISLPTPPPKEASAQRQLPQPRVRQARGSAQRSEGTRDDASLACRSGEVAPRPHAGSLSSGKRCGGLEGGCSPGGACGAQSAPCKHNSGSAHKLFPVTKHRPARLTHARGLRAAADLGDESLGELSCAFLQQGWVVSSHFFRCALSFCPFLHPNPPPQASASRRLGSLPATFLWVDVAFLSSPILITLEFVNHISPKL